MNVAVAIQDAQRDRGASARVAVASKGTETADSTPRAPAPAQGRPPPHRPLQNDISNLANSRHHRQSIAVSFDSRRSHQGIGAVGSQVLCSGMYQDRKIAAVNSKGKGKATMPAVTAGKKRKDQGRKANGKAAAVPAPLQAPEAEPELDEAGLLLREIKSLGGDEEDFKFLKDVDVDDEDEAIVNDTVEDVSAVPAAVHRRAFPDILP